MNRLIPALAGAGMVLASGMSLGADDGVSANVTFTSDYVFRGISQTDESFAVQGGFDYSFGNGVYLGTWASTIDDAGFNGATAEIDLYAGVSGSLGDSGLGWDLNAVYYYYPDQTGSDVNINFIEINPSLTWSGIGGLTASLGVAYSNDYFFESGDSFYYSLNASMPLMNKLTVAAHVGHQTIEENDTFGVPDYTDWSLGVSTNLVGLGWSLAYIDTTVDDDECFSGSNLCDATAVVSVSKSF